MVLMKVLVAIIFIFPGLGGVDDIFVRNGVLVLQNLGTDLEGTAHFIVTIFKIPSEIVRQW